MDTAANILLIITLISVLLGIIVIVGGKIGKWVKNRDNRLAHATDVKQEALSVRSLTNVAETEIHEMIKANQEINLKIAKLCDMVQNIDAYGSKRSIRMFEKFDSKVEGFAKQLASFEKQLVRLDTLVQVKMTANCDASPKGVADG